jgi:hypothetical protein
LDLEAVELAPLWHERDGNGNACLIFGGTPTTVFPLQDQLFRHAPLFVVIGSFRFESRWLPGRTRSVQGFSLSAAFDLDLDETIEDVVQGSHRPIAWLRRRAFAFAL